MTSPILSPKETSINTYLMVDYNTTPFPTLITLMGSYTKMGDPNILDSVIEHIYITTFPFLL
jgi:hypothetical protein